jgi:molybdopterin molybdotransferase
VTLSFEEARAMVLREVCSCEASEQCSLAEAGGRVLAEDISADRDYPPFHRSARDGFAVRAADLPGELLVAGEIRAGDVPSRAVQAGEAIEIMTGAPMPPGADAVVMIEHSRRNGAQVVIERGAKSGDNFAPRGTEARAGEVVLRRGGRLDYADIALLAMVGRGQVLVFRRPRVAILATGDELVDVDGSGASPPLPDGRGSEARTRGSEAAIQRSSMTPGDFQIRNSNAYSIAAQVRQAGAIAEVLPIARDEYESTRGLIERGLRDADLLLLSGGVSAGKYDIVEKVLADLGARFFFDRVAIQPGQPVVFGTVGGKCFFGLPGNPVSTMVTFELFARAAIDRLSGCDLAPLPLMRARITRDFRHKPGLTRFLPATVSEDGATVTPVEWHGSGDVPAVARANAFLVAEADRESWKEGEDIRVLLR